MTEGEGWPKIIHICVTSFLDDPFMYYFESELKKMAQEKTTKLKQGGLRALSKLKCAGADSIHTSQSALNSGHNLLHSFNPTLPSEPY